ncbi:MAG: ATP-binding protein [Vicinamibacterales bacterium]
MIESVRRVFDTSGLLPRWPGRVWRPAPGRAQVVSGVALGAGRLVRAAVAPRVVPARRDVPFRQVLVRCGACMIACGTLHLLEAVIAGWPLDAAAGAATAAVSWASVFALIPVWPGALAPRGSRDLQRAVDERTAALEAANAALQREIEERRAVEERLRQSEARLRLAFDAGRMGAWDLDLQGGRIEWSGHLGDAQPIPEGSFTGSFDDFLALVQPEDRARVAATFDQARADCAEFEVEFRHPRPDGSSRWIAGRGSVVCDEHGTPIRIVGLGIDVTARRRAEESARFLARASGALSDIVDEDSALRKVASLAVPQIADWCAIQLATPDGQLRGVGVAHADPARLGAAQALQREYPADPAAPRGAYSVLRSGRTEFVFDLDPAALSSAARDDRHRSLLGAIGLRSIISAPLKYRGGVLGIIQLGMAHSGRRYSEIDVRQVEDLATRAAGALENVRLYAALREADRRKDEFLAVLAHELRNPLAPLTVGLQVLRGPADPADPGGRGRILTAMERQLQHLNRLVDDLLDVARIARGKIELVQEPCSLAEVLDRAVEMAEPIVASRRHELIVDVPARPIPVRVDAVRIAQVVSNLLNNAAKYSEPGREIRLSAATEEGQAVVRVRDQGVGIQRERLGELFTLFGQAAPEDARLGGLGIGLYLVRMLVMAHGGTVEATSEGPGLGSEFVVRLPLQAVTDGAGPPAEPEAAAPRRILVVDDNRDSLDTLAMLLRMHGHDVQTAVDGQSTFELLERFTPDVALLDIGLPDTDGYQIARAMRAAAGTRPLLLIAVTGWGGRADRLRSREAGFDEHLVKPVDWEELQRILDPPA